MRSLPNRLALILLVAFGIWLAQDQAVRERFAGMFSLGLVLAGSYQVLVNRWRGLLAVLVLSAIGAVGVFLLVGAVPPEILYFASFFAFLWLAREIIVWLWRLLAQIAQRWGKRPSFKRARARRPKKLEPATVAVPGRAANVSAEEIIKRLVPKPEQPKVF